MATCTSLSELEQIEHGIRHIRGVFAKPKCTLTTSWYRKYGKRIFGAAEPNVDPNNKN